MSTAQHTPGPWIPRMVITGVWVIERRNRREMFGIETPKDTRGRRLTWPSESAARAAIAKATRSAA